MSQEIELKFQVDGQLRLSLCDFLQTQKIIEQHSLHLTNTYYDSDDHILRNNRSSLRIRGINELAQPTEYELTVKSSGKSLAGLHARQEFNISLPDNQLDLNMLPEFIFAGIKREKLTQNLEAQFTTDFERQTWLIDYKQSQIEVALDQGCIATKKSSVPICEVELELKGGSALDLLFFALELSQFDMHLYSQSKAARGYALLENQSLVKIPFKTDSVTLSEVLQYWQSNEEYALEHNDLLFYKEILAKVVEYLAPMSWSTDETDVIQIKPIYTEWAIAFNSMTNVKNFAFSKINNQLKINLLQMLQ